MGSYQNDVLYALLAVVGSGVGPIGTRTAQRSLEDMGLSMSESSVSRRLRDLDTHGWTSRVGAKGRVLSREGRQQLTDAQRTAPIKAATGPLVDVKDVQDVLDLLVARQAVESAAAGDAAMHSAPEDVESLQPMLDNHRVLIDSGRLSEQPGLQLHRQVAAIAPNSKLKVLTGLMLAPHLDGVEAVLDLILGSKAHQQSSLEDHQEIVDAIVRRDSERAQKAMNDHFVRMVAATEKSLVGDGGGLLERLLVWVDPSSD